MKMFQVLVLLFVSTVSFAGEFVYDPRLDQKTRIISERVTEVAVPLSGALLRCVNRPMFDRSHRSDIRLSLMELPSLGVLTRTSTLTLRLREEGCRFSETLLKMAAENGGALQANVKVTLFELVEFFGSTSRRSLVENIVVELLSENLESHQVVELENAESLRR